MRLLVLSVCLVAALAAPVDEWDLFKTSFGKAFLSTEEDDYRLGVFMKTLEQIKKHNQKYDAGKSTYYQGINQFSDWTEEEFKDIMLMKEMPTHPKGTPARVSDGPIPSDIDWVSKGHVTSVRNQASCGSCWAFAAVANLESGYSIANGGKLVDLSEQQCVDCDPWSNGCSGGWHHYCYDYISNAGGIVDEGSYPYTAQDDYCNFANVKDKRVTTCSTYYEVTGDAGLRTALGSIPVAVAVNASPWKSYKGGIYDDELGCWGRVNHAVMATGFTTSGSPYFSIKNSWGGSWGESGYIRLARGTDVDMCGVTTMGAYPEMADVV